MWKIDTLLSTGSPEVSMLSVWGSSRQNVWAVGHNADLSANIYHFDGNYWAPFPAISGTPYTISYRSVIGFSQNDVYAAGLREYWNPRPGVNYEDSSFVVHFDGSHWNVVDLPPGRGLLRIWGNSASDIWVGGDFGTLFHYDGSIWRRKSFDSTQSIGPIFGFGTGEVYSISTYYDVVNNPDTAFYFFNEYEFGVWEKKNSMKVTNDLYAYGFGHLGIWGTDPSNLFSFGPKVYRRNGTSWNLLFGEAHLFNDMKGSSSNNIFIVGDHGLVYHFDGTSWSEIRAYNNTVVRFVSVMPFERDVYILASYNNQTYVLHGKALSVE